MGKRDFVQNFNLTKFDDMKQNKSFKDFGTTKSKNVVASCKCNVQPWEDCEHSNPMLFEELADQAMSEILGEDYNYAFSLE